MGVCSAQLRRVRRAWDAYARHRLRQISAASSADARRLGELLLLGQFPLAVVGICASALGMMLDRPGAALGNLPAIGFCTVTPFLLKSRAGLRVAAHLFVASALCAIITGVAAGGVTGRSAYPFLFLTPLIVGFVLELKGLTVWSVPLTLLALDLKDNQLDLHRGFGLGAVEAIEGVYIVLAMATSLAAVSSFLFVKHRALEEVTRTTKQLRAEVAVRTKAEAAARDAAAAKANFLAMMSHEIRTPMNGVLGMTQLLADHSLPSEAEEHVKTLDASAQALLTVLNDVLDFSKIEAGKLRFDLAPFDLRALLRRSVALLRPVAQRKSLDVWLDIDPTTPHWVRGDGNRVTQVVGNLMSNAVKFTAEGSVVLRVRRTVTETIRIEVIDTGIGIAPENRARLFHPFEQAEASTTRRFGGTGLGLAISRRIVELMGGHIGVRSELGHGSTFWVELDLPTVSAPESNSDPAVETTLRASARVLVVDDNAVNRLVARRMLEKLGLKVVLVASGEQALETLDAEAIDLVLMDVQMPGMDGYEATRRIRQNPARQDLPIIGWSANVMDTDRERGFDAGMNTYLTKPLRQAELRHAIERFVPAPTEPWLPSPSTEAVEASPQSSS